MTVTKIGIDETKPHELPHDMFKLANVPEDIREKIFRRLERLGI